MADNDDRYDNEVAGAGFMMGLLTGTVLGAGLGILLAPKAGSELRGALGEQARTFSTRASEQYRRASSSANTLAEKGREFVDRAREAAGRGAEEGAEEGNAYRGSSMGGSSFGSTGTSGSPFGGSNTSGSDSGRS
jgi:gas vesicle protein